MSAETFRLLVDSVRDYAIFMLDPEGVVVTWNEGAARINGYAASEIIGTHFSVFYTPSAIASGWPEYELATARAEGRLEDEGWRVRKDGTRFWSNVVITPMRDATGELIGYAKITRDLTEQRRQEHLLRESEERFRLLVEEVKDYALFTLDTDGRVVSWNSGAQNIKGYSADEVIGRHFSSFYPEDAVRSGWPRKLLDRARTEGRAEDEGWRVRKDGTLFWANVVIAPLHDSSGRLRGYAKITRDMTTRKQMEELEQASRNMTQFLAMLAHELRNPLAPIRNALHVMAANPGDPATGARCREIIDRQASHLVRLVDDLLDATRITTGKIQLRKATVDLKAVVLRALDYLDRRKHTVEVALPDEPVYVEGDAARLLQVVSNLLHNAAKYTHAGGRIQCSLEQDGDVAMIRVKDDGIGIAPELLPHVFELFRQGDGSLERASGGLGVGLALVQTITFLHGGSVEARSDGAGKGSEFRVMLPKTSTASAEATPKGRPVAPADDGEGKRILVVDDNRDSAETLAAILGAWGYRVECAYDGLAAVAAAAAFKPHVVLLDIGLPRLSGYDVARRLKQLPELSGVGLIAITGYGQEEDRRQVREAGFDLHLVKPVDPVVLMQSIASM